MPRLARPLAVSIFSLLASIASAGTLVQSTNLSGSGDGYGNGFAAAPIDWLFATYSGPYALTGVTFEAQIESTTRAHDTNPFDFALDATPFLNLETWFTLGSVSELLFLTDPELQQQLGPTVTVQPGESYEIDHTFITNLSVSFTSPESLSWFTTHGADRLHLAGRLFGSSDFGTSELRRDAAMTLTYHYAVPDAGLSGAAAVGLALAGLVIARRRSRPRS